jgi:hypothetical protein
MTVYKILICNATDELGDTKVPMTLAQFQAVTAPGGCALWPELAEAFSCPQPDLVARAVWQPELMDWVQNLDSEQAAELYPVCGGEPGFW